MIIFVTFFSLWLFLWHFFHCDYFCDIFSLWLFLWYFFIVIIFVTFFHCDIFSLWLFLWFKKMFNAFCFRFVFELNLFFIDFFCWFITFELLFEFGLLEKCFYSFLDEVLSFVIIVIKFNTFFYLWLFKAKMVEQLVCLTRLLPIKKRTRVQVSLGAWFTLLPLICAVHCCH